MLHHADGRGDRYPDSVKVKRLGKLGVDEGGERADVWDRVPRFDENGVLVGTEPGNHCLLVGDYCFLGVNSCVSNGVKLAPRTFVGANVLISQDTVDRGAYVAPAPKQVPMPSDRFLSMLKIT